MISIVVGLGFGDEGKGSVVDSLLMSHPLKDTLVIRTASGPQCGHTVMIDENTKHTHSNFCSGALRGADSYFTDNTFIYPPAILNELQTLQSKGSSPRLFIHGFAQVILPCDIAYGIVRNDRYQHGTTGMGVGAANMRSKVNHYKVYVQDLMVPEIFQVKSNNILKMYIKKLEDEGFLKEDVEKFYQIHEALSHDFSSIQNYNFINLVYRNNNLMSNYKHLIFEGNQGFYLDQDYGFFPNVTYANTTVVPALNFIEKEVRNYSFSGGVHVYGVTRAYTTRHGNGWMPKEGQDVELKNTEHEINVKNAFQGEFRKSPFDIRAFKYARDTNMALLIRYLGRDYNFTSYYYRTVVTCLDQMDLDISEIDELTLPKEIFGNKRSNRINNFDVDSTLIRNSPISVPFDDVNYLLSNSESSLPSAIENCMPEEAMPSKHNKSKN